MITFSSRGVYLSFLVASSAMAAGCSSEPANQASANVAVDSVTVAEAEPPAAEPQEAAAPAQPDCTPPKAKAGDPPDVAGVRIGMTADEAALRVQCANPGLAVSAGNYTSSFFRTVPDPLGNQAREFIKTEGNGGTAPDEFFIALAGPPGGERVVGIARALRFAEGEEPTVDSLISQVRTKYGLTPSQGQYPRAGDPWGASRGGEGYDCLPPAIEMQAQMEPMKFYGLKCPPYVGAKIYPRQSNLALARELRVVVTDPPLATRLVAETNAANRASAEQQRRQEINAASKRSGPSL
jgi:hypothetical protein